MDLQSLLDAISLGAKPRTTGTLDFERVEYDPRSDMDLKPWAAHNGLHVSRWSTDDIRLLATREFAAAEAKRLDGQPEFWTALLDNHQPARTSESGWAVRHVHTGHNELCFRFWPVTIHDLNRAVFLLDDHSRVLPYQVRDNATGDQPGVCLLPIPTGVGLDIPALGPNTYYHLRLAPAFLAPDL